MDEHPPQRETFGRGLAALLVIAIVGAFYFSVIQNKQSIFARGSETQTEATPSGALETKTPSTPAVATTASVTTTKEANILFVGDMFFDRHIRQVSVASGGDYLFSCIDPLLASADFVVGNLEGPITNNRSVSVGSIVGSANNYRFTFSTTTAPLLLAHHIQAVSLGNNHITNFGMSGLLQTHTNLDAAGVGYFGGVAGSEPVYQTNDGGVPLSLIGYNEFGGSSAALVALTILQERAKGRVVIVFAHWGTEYSTTTVQTRPIATLFAESGASAIIGSHPHIVGVHEYIGDTLVYYSLGNFMFDQYFSNEVMHGLALMLHIAPGGKIIATEYPTELERDGRTCQELLQ